MRPQKLTLKNFMPFRSVDGNVQEIDFSNLDLFAITGPMASGKSSLVDAIVWCLYSRTARYGADSKGVISAGENLCEVAFDFTIGDRWFRAVRRTGRTTESGLSEREGEEWIQDVSGSERLTERIEQLLGLDFDSFTKTVILPQGKYAEFLSSKPGDRRELLANILELGVYSRVADRAKTVAAQAKTRADTLRETLAQYVGVSRERVEQQRSELAAVGKQFADTSAREEMLRELVRQAEGVTTLLARLNDLTTEERTRANEKAQAAQKQSGAEAQLQSLAQDIAQVTADQESLGYDADRHGVVKRAIVHLREYHTAQQVVDLKTQALVTAQQELDDLGHRIETQEQEVSAAHRSYQAHDQALQAEIAKSGDVTSLTEKLAAAKRWKELRQERERLTEQQQQQTDQLVRVRQCLSALVQQEAAKEQESRDLLQLRDRRREEEQEKARREIEADSLDKELQEATREEKRLAIEVTEVRAAAQTVEGELLKQQTALTRAEQQEQMAVNTLDEARRRNEAEHLRSALHVGEPCPVCQMPIRELPPPSAEVSSDLSALQRVVDTAKAGANSARQALQKAHAAAAATVTRRETAERELAVREQKRHELQARFVSRFPGFPSLAAALRTLQTQQQELTTALKELAIKSQAAEKEKQALSRQREQSQREEATLAEEVRGIAASLATSETQLTDLAQLLTSILSESDDPEAVLKTRRQTLTEREQAVKASEQQQRQAETTLATLKTSKIQKEGAAAVLTSQRDAAAAQAAREALAVRESLTLLAESPLPGIAQLEEELAALVSKQERHATLAEREKTLREERDKAERQMAEFRADLQARARALGETQKSTAQVETDLEHARAKLRAGVVERGLFDVSENGEGLKEQLAALHEHVIALREHRSRLGAEIAEVERRCIEKEQEEEKLCATETENRLATDLHKMLGAEFTDFLSQEAVEALMRDATVHLRRLTHGRYSFDIVYRRGARGGIELQIVDHEDQRRARPTHSLSGGETFLASLAIALALSQAFREVATGKSARTSTECLILDEGFGTLDREGIQLVTETLQELRGEEGRMVGIITHVEEVAAAMPVRIVVSKGNQSSTITVSG